MKQYSTFIFDSYSFDETSRLIELKYSLDNEIHFTEKISLPDNFQFSILHSELLSEALFNLHLIGGISYFKTCLPKRIDIRSGTIDEEQANYWNTVYTKGLGEFFYKNNIDPHGVVNFIANSSKRANEQTNHDLKTGKTLVPVGGGKDSIVTIEILKKEGLDLTLFRMNAHPLIKETARIAGLPLLNVERTLDAQLFALNKEGALNGHVPATAYVSWLSIVVSILYGFDTIALSNESSANEGNTEFHGMEINHQWSKSEEFEAMMQRYLKHFISTDLTYFSVLRPLSEFQVAKLFSELPDYYDVMTSCNANWKILESQKLTTNNTQTSKWCCACPKCAFVFAILSPFIKKDRLVQMFGKDLFADESLIPLYKELLGLTNIKPFECVGTPQETTAAMLMAHDKKEYNGSPVMKVVEEEVLTNI